MSRSARTRLLAPVAVVALLLGLAACGDDKDKAAATAAPPTDLVLKVLKDGSGELVQAGDSVTVDYQGTIWGGKIFDQSYGKPDDATFATNQVVQGFGAALVGQKVGSQVVVSIPPALGYGPNGDSSAGISGTDTLVFVIDIKGTKRGTPLSCKVKPGSISDSVKVSGTVGGTETKVTFKKPLKTPSTQRTVVKPGSGVTPKAGETVNVAASVFNGRTGKPLGQAGTFDVPLGHPQVPAYLSDGLNCAKVGSRIVTTFKANDVIGAAGDPTNDIKGSDTLIQVIDVVKVVPPITPQGWTSPPTVVFNGDEPPTLTLPKA